MPRAVPIQTRELQSKESKKKAVGEVRRAEILTAAAKVFAREGYSAANVEDIARAAHVAKGTLYLYFKSKDAIYAAVMEQALAKLHSLTEEHVHREPRFAGKLAAFISVRIAFWQNQQQLYRVILSINREGPQKKRSIGWQRQAVLYLESMFAEAVKAGEIPSQDLMAAAWTIMDSIRGVNERRVYSEGRPKEDDTAFLARFLLAAMQAPQGPMSPGNGAAKKSG